MKIAGEYTISEVTPSGLVVLARGTNFLTEAGEAYLAAILAGSGSIGYWAIGDGSGQDRSDTALDSEVGRNALEGGYPQQDTGGDDNDVLWRVIFDVNEPSSSVSYTITECALFTAASAGTMINYMEVDPGVYKTPSLTWQLDLRWTVGGS